MNITRHSRCAVCSKQIQKHQTVLVNIKNKTVIHKHCSFQTFWDELADAKPKKKFSREPKPSKWLEFRDLFFGGK